MKLRTALILGVLLTGTAGSFWRFGVQRSVLDVSRDDVHFPTVSGTNLDRQEMTFPADFAGALNILFVPFLQSQQPVVDTWVPFAQDAEAAFPGVVYYELPTINNMPGLARTFINEGMRAGIPDQTLVGCDLLQQRRVRDREHVDSGQWSIRRIQDSTVDRASVRKHDSTNVLVRDIGTTRNWCFKPDRESAYA